MGLDRFDHRGAQQLVEREQRPDPQAAALHVEPPPARTDASAMEGQRPPPTTGPRGPRGFGEASMQLQSSGNERYIELEQLVCLGCGDDVEDQARGFVHPDGPTCAPPVSVGPAEVSPVTSTPGLDAHLSTQLNGRSTWTCRANQVLMLLVVEWEASCQDVATAAARLRQRWSADCYC